MQIRYEVEIKIGLPVDPRKYFHVFNFLLSKFFNTRT
jgi:hypothetical protein